MMHLQLEIAQRAAQFIVDEGAAYGQAKQLALKSLGLPNRTALPDNDMLEQAVREHIALFCSESQAEELKALRLLALKWMERLAQYQPLISGAVWHGTATRLSELYLQLFSDDVKAAEITLLNAGIDYQASEVIGLHGQAVPALSLLDYAESLDEEIGVHLMIYEYDAMRGALLKDKQNRKPRGNTEELRKLLYES